MTCSSINVVESDVCQIRRCHCHGYRVTVKLAHHRHELAAEFAQIEVAMRRVRMVDLALFAALYQMAGGANPP